MPLEPLTASSALPQIGVVGRALRCGALAGLALLVSAPAAAWVLNIKPGPRQLFLMVGVGTPDANNSTVNTVSVTLPALSVGSGAAQPMATDSTQQRSPFRNYTTCDQPGQVYIGASYRQPSASAGADAAALQVSTPPNLTSGSSAITFTQISWTSTARGRPAAHIPAGTFSGGTQFLANVPRNYALENCFTYTYANTVVVPAGTFTGRAAFTLTVP